MANIIINGKFPSGCIPNITIWIYGMLMRWRSGVGLRRSFYYDLDYWICQYEQIISQTIAGRILIRRRVYSLGDVNPENTPDIQDLFYFADKILKIYAKNGTVEKCCICWTDTYNITPCGHHIHKACINKWACVKPTCPMCRCEF